MVSGGIRVEEHPEHQNGSWWCHMEMPSWRCFLMFAESCCPSSSYSEDRRPLLICHTLSSTSFWKQSADETVTPTFSSINNRNHTSYYHQRFVPGSHQPAWTKPRQNHPIGSERSGGTIPWLTKAKCGLRWEVTMGGHRHMQTPIQRGTQTGTHRRRLACRSGRTKQSKLSIPSSRNRSWLALPGRGAGISDILAIKGTWKMTK